MRKLKPTEVRYLAQGFQALSDRAMIQNQEIILKVHVLNHISASSIFLLSKHSALPKKALVINRNVCLVTYPITVGAKEDEDVATW